MISESSERKFLVVKQPYKPCEIITTDETALEIKTLQTIVGGYIQPITTKLKSGKILNVIIDEEGQLKDKEPNLLLTINGRMAGVITGTALVCALQDANLVPLTLDEARESAKQLNTTTIAI